MNSEVTANMTVGSAGWEPYPWNNPSPIPYIQNSFTVWPALPNPYFPWQVRKVENGFILTANGKELVFEKIDSLLKYLAKDLLK